MSVEYTTVDRHIRRLLELNAAGLTVERLRSLINKGGNPAGKEDVIATLQELHKEGFASVGPDRKWRARHAVEIRRNAGINRHGNGATDDLPGPGARLEALPVTAAEGPAGGSEASLPEGNLNADAALLTKLLPYYQEALRAGDEPRQNALPTEKHGVTFALLRPYGSWWPTRESGSTLRIARSVLPAELEESIAKRGGRKLLLGYPNVAVGQRGQDESPFLRPVGLQRCGFRFTDDHLELHLPPAQPGINQDWLRGARHYNWTPERLQSWLYWEDVDDRVEEDDEIEGPDFVDFHRFSQRLASAMRRQVRSALDPTVLDDHLDGNPVPGIYNIMTLIADAEGPYTRGAVGEYDRLQKLEPNDFEGTGLGALFGARPMTFERLPLIHPLELSETQLAASRGALEGPLTVITGPPGTGKSQVIASIMVSAAAAGKSVLFASRNHKALDAVQERLDDVTGETPLLTRASSQESGGGFSFAQAITALQTSGAAGEQRAARRAYDQLREVDERRWVLLHEWQALARASDRVARALDEIESIQRKLREERAAAGQEALSSLVAAGTGGVESSRRHGRTLWFRIVSRPVDWLRNCLDGVFARLGFGGAPEIGHRRRIRDLEKNLAKAGTELERAETDVKERRRALESESETPVELTRQVTRKSEDYVPRLAERLRSVSQAEREELTAIAGDQQISGGRSSELSERAMSAVLAHMPLWAVTTLSASSRIPLHAGVFDYVIFDEASQVDIASALPLLYRAKAAVVVGDPNQLTMISKIPAHEEQQLLKRWKLLREGIGRYAQSVTDFFAFANSAGLARQFLLTEHFRCHPEIADYINEAFYGRKLTALTDVARLRIPAHGDAGLNWTDVQGPVKKRGDGRSGGSAASEREATAILEEVRRLIEGGYKGTIGAVTFFRYQAEIINRELGKAFSGDQLKRHNLRVFTTTRFQGDERDVILFSLCLSRDMPPGARYFIQQERRLLNVSVSRARAVCHVFGDHGFAKTSGIPHIEKLARKAERNEQRGPGRYDDAFDSIWERRLYDALVEKGLNPIPQYPSGGRFLDLALIDDSRKPGVYLDIEVDGVAYHQDYDGQHLSSDLWRDHQLRGLGWKILRFWVYELREDMEGCVERISAEYRG
jgi:very-short-patch-repair endonuclease